MKRRHLSNQKGFTIVELLVASSVFSVILLVVTTGVVSFTTAFYKVQTESTNQLVAHNILDKIGQAVQFSTVDPTQAFPSYTSQAPAYSGGPTSGSGSFCAGGQVFAYTLFQQRPQNDASTTAELRFSSGPCQTSGNAGYFTSGQEMLNPGMRLANLTFTPVVVDIVQADGTHVNKQTGGWIVHLRLVTGDDDQLCSPSVAGSCSDTATLTPAQLEHTDLQCRGVKGSQFCTVDDITQVFQKRL